MSDQLKHLEDFMGVKPGTYSNSQEFKADGGKTRPTLVSIGFAKALRVVQATTDYGAYKYEAHSWKKVPEGIERYTEAAARHRQEREIYMGHFPDAMYDNLTVLAADEESGIPHIAHEIFCLLAVLELALSEPNVDYRAYTHFNPPPLDHKVKPTPGNPNGYAPVYDPATLAYLADPERIA